MHFFPIFPVVFRGGMCVYGVNVTNNSLITNQCFFKGNDILADGF